MPAPEISVVIPVYNVRDYLPKCLDSVLGQTFRDFELIAVNDGSKDDSLEILKRYAEQDERIRIIDKANGGLSDARNAGMAVARGEFIQFIDSDDFIEPDLLGKCRAKLQATGADMVIFDVYQYHQKTGLRETIRNCYDDSAVYTLAEHPEMMTKILNAAWNKMYRLALFQDSGITYPWGCYYEDLGTTYRLLARCRKIAFLNEPLYDYLVDRPGNLTSQFSFSAYHVLDMIKITADDFKANGWYEQYYEELKYLAGVNIMECLKKTRDVQDAKMVDKYIDVCFWFLNRNWPEFPRCKYKICREKNDWIYVNPTRLKLYLNYRRKKHAVKEA